MYFSKEERINKTELVCKNLKRIEKEFQWTKKINISKLFFIILNFL